MNGSGEDEMRSLRNINVANKIWVWPFFAVAFIGWRTGLSCYPESAREQRMSSLQDIPYFLGLPKVEDWPLFLLFHIQF